MKLSHHEKAVLFREESRNISESNIREQRKSLRELSDLDKKIASVLNTPQLSQISESNKGQAD